MPDPITRLNAALEGCYRVERELGEGGVHMKVIQGRLRHTSIKTTMDVYSHLRTEMDSQAAEVFDTIMQEPRG